MSRAVEKRKKKQPLTPDETQVLRDYAKAANQRAIKVYFDSVEQKQRLQKRADADGAGSFSAWLIKVAEHGLESTHSDSDYERLQKDLERARKELELRSERELNESRVKRQLVDEHEAMSNRLLEVKRTIQQEAERLLHEKEVLERENERLRKKLLEGSV